MSATQARNRRDRDVIAAALAACPNLEALVALVPNAMSTINSAWTNGAERFGHFHPLIELILGDNHTARRDALESGLAALRIDNPTARDFARRIVTDTSEGFVEATSALTELFVGGRLALVGAETNFPRPRKDKKTPDIAARRGRTHLTVEVASVNESDDVRKIENGRTRAFLEWKPPSLPPEILRGNARATIVETPAGPKSIKIRSRMSLPLGGGNAGAQIDRLILRKDDVPQLRGHPNGLLVVSSWHVWGIDRDYCLPLCHLARRSPHVVTGRFFAATYGHAGDDVFEGEEFDGHPMATATQRQDGILVRPSNAGAVLWLLQSDPSVFMERRSAGPALDEDARRLAIDAFEINAADGISRLRSSSS